MSNIQGDGLSLVDRVLGWLSPSWALRRQRARTQLQAVRAYDALVRDRLRARKTPAHIGPLSETSANRSDFTAIARDLDRNNGWARGVFNAISDNVVGEGIIAEPQVRRRRGGLDDRLSLRVADRWRRWADGAGLDGRSLYDLQWEIEREQWVAGEMFLIRTAPREARPIPLALELVESERLSDLEKDSANGGKIIQGIEFSPTGKILAYHFWPNHPNDSRLLTTSPERVEAARVVHFAERHRPGMVRGLSRIAPVAKTFEALAQYFDHELTRARIASAFVAAIKKQGSFAWPSTGNASDTTDDNDNDLGQIEGGMFLRLGEGESMDFASARLDTAFESFVIMMLRSLSAGLNVSYELLTRDFSRTNYSSARQSQLEDRKHWRPRQQRFNRVVNKQVWEWFLEGLAAGPARLPELDLIPEELFSVAWKPPGWEWVDPQKEVAANKEAIKAGLESPQDVATRRGKDLDEVFREIAEAKTRAEELGLSLDIFSSGQPAAPPPGQAGQEEESEDESEDEGRAIRGLVR